MSEIHDGEPSAKGGRAPEGDARRCTANNRAGVRCGRWAAPGMSVCHNHGARSTGPRTAAGKLRSLAAVVRHGGRATSDLYREALRSANPGVYDAAGGLDVERELRLARVRLVEASHGADDETIATLLGVVARLVAVQAAMQRETSAAAPPAPFRLTLEVVEPRRLSPVAEASEAPPDDPVDPPVTVRGS
ncbi:HGGxSTG domain-containing protein [Anaeromyxobacter sp. SG64]|uniref:HGGxSTG domain-containing protein n=1 Tax=Anaeromyxobacter sp. SG64 TaxID=2925409 RepID=UPI001F56F988|nr:HGGxSTG domain-containing protein [Anaeromyxobacter sp. SG64]